MRLQRLTLLAIVFILLGCTRFQQTAVPASPTPQPSPAPVTLTPAPAATLPPVTDTPLPQPTATQTITATVPALSATPTRRRRTPTPTPTITLTPTLNVSDVAMRIVSPGPMSKVVSPIDFVVHVDPDYTGVTRIELIGEDGRELYRKVFKTYSNIGYFTRVNEKINFEISGAAEVARLQISSEDEYGILQAFSSVRLLLQSVGENQFSPAYLPVERVGLRYPKKGEEVTGGILPITGEFLPFNDTPLIMELFDAEGRLLGSRQLQFAPYDGNYQPFTTTIPYEVTARTPARLVLRQSDDRIGGLAYLYSIAFNIGP